MLSRWLFGSVKFFSPSLICLSLFHSFWESTKFEIVFDTTFGVDLQGSDRKRLTVGWGGGGDVREQWRTICVVQFDVVSSRTNLGRDVSFFSVFLLSETINLFAGKRTFLTEPSEYQRLKIYQKPCSKISFLLFLCGATEVWDLCYSTVTSYVNSVRLLYGPRLIVVDKDVPSIVSYFLFFLWNLKLRLSKWLSAVPCRKIICPVSMTVIVQKRINIRRTPIHVTTHSTSLYWRLEVSNFRCMSLWNYVMFHGTCW